MYLRLTCRVSGQAVKPCDLRRSGQAQAVSRTGGTRQAYDRYTVRHNRDMRIHGALEGWLVLEAILSVPGAFGLIGLVLARPLRELRLMNTDVFLQSVLYPQAGAIVGAALGVGAGELWAGKPDGLLIVAFGGIVLPIIGGAGIGKRLRQYRREDESRLAPSSWQPDVERLGMMRQLTQQDRQYYLTRAAELATAGHDKCGEAKRSRFGAFWVSRSRRTRWTGYFWVFFGALVSASGTRSVGSAWGLAALPLGLSWIGYQWVIWKLQKEMTAAEGLNLLEGAELIEERIQRLPLSREHAPRWRSLRLAILGGPGS